MPRPDFFDGDPGEDKDEMYRFRTQEGGSGVLPEILRRTYMPELFLFATRKSIAGQESLLTQGQEPDQWTFRILRDTIDGRKTALSLEQYLGIMQKYSLREYGLGGKDSQPVTKEKVLNMIPATEAAKAELLARWTLLEALSKQGKMSTDVGNYARDYFLATWATWPEARHYGIVGKLSASPIIPERNPNKEVISFGRLVDEALRGWDAIARQEPIWPGGDKPSVKNIFAHEPFQDLIDKAVEWIIAHLEKVSGYQLPGEKVAREASLGYQDLAEAANLAFLLFRQTDMDVSYCWREKADSDGKIVISDMLAQVTQAIDLYKLEIGPLAKDSAKLAWWVLRSLAEAGREYPASIGLPLLVGKFPNLTTDFLRMMSVIRETTDSGKKATQAVSLYKLWRIHGVQFGDLPWDIEEWEKGKIVFDKSEVAGTRDSNGKEREWSTPKGVTKTAFNVPYFLEIFYAYTKIYSVLTQADVTKTLEILTNPGELRNLNKAWSLIFSMMCAELEECTTRRVMQLCKCNLEGAAFLANSALDLKGIDVENEQGKYTEPQAPDEAIRITKITKAAFLGMQIRLGKQAGFLTRAKGAPINDDQLTTAELAELEELTIKEIVNKKRALFPSEACRIKTRSGKTWFNREEIQRIRNSDLYRPFGNCV